MKLVLAAILLVASFGASATNNNPPNECGNHGNNCQPSGGSNEANSNATGTGYGGAGGNGLGVGIGVGIGGSAQGGQGGSGGMGGAGGVGIAAGGQGGSVKDSGNSANFNSNTANGGDASQSQSSRNDNTNVSKSVAQMASENSASLKNTNANNSQASGNTTVTNVGGDSTLVERNAPPVFLGNLSATMSCSGGFNAGASDRNGSGAFGFTWISGDCRSVVIGREFVGIGMPDVACRVWKTTKGYKRAVKADPSLADVDCTIKPAPAAAPVLVAPELAPRIPRG